MYVWELQAGKGSNGTQKRSLGMRFELVSDGEVG